MKPRKLFLMECHIAGRKYHDADEVWDELKVGTQLTLKRDTENRYDPNAVAIVYTKNDEEYLLGYIPRDENDTLAAFLDMGWDDVFECRLSKVNEAVHYEEQLHATIRIKQHPTNNNRRP